MIATRARNLWMIAAAATLLATASGRAAALCVGDCNGNNAVVINELLTGVGVSLGDRDVASCRNFDPDDDERVNVNELVQGVNSAINGCPPIDAGLAAFSTSNHYVDVHFPAPVGVEAVDPGNYSIKATDNSPLAVHAARATADPTVITLITDGQDAVRYRLTYAPTSDVAPFDGSTLGEGRLVRARALDNTHVLLTFDVDLYDDAAPPEPGSPSGGAALDRASYRIANPDLNVAAAVFPDGGSEAKRAIILTTAGQSALQYTLVAAGVVDADGRHLDPDSLSAQFDGIAVDDHVAPRLTDVVPAGAQIIVLTFSEPLAPTAADPRLFSITPSVEVTGAQLTNHGTQVVLSTGPQISGQTYTITVTGVRDQAGNLIDPNAKQMTFPSSGPTVEPDELPRVVGAVSTSNLTVVVHFSESMSAAALDPTHYSVELEPDVGVLTLVSRCVAGEHVGQLCGSPGFTLHVCEGGVHPGRLCQSDIDCGMGTCGTSCSGSDCQGARFLDANHTQVEIQTISQNDGIYTLTAAGVTDAAGHPLAPRHVVAGAVIDPTSATFAGIGPFTNGMIPDNAGVDSDGDGMPDTDEQAGWDVTVTLLNGDRATQHVTANPLFPDTDNDGLVDPLEFAIGTNPRSNDTDGEGLQDAEEYNVVYSDPTKQDTDDDGISDNLEVELFKTNAILADSDGDGYSDGQELFEMNRDPRIADVPRTRISVASEQLRIDERFTYTDENGDTQTSNSSTTTSLQNASASGTGSHKEDGKDIFFSITGGVEDCQSDCTSGVIFGGGGLLARLKLEATAGANFTHLESTDTSSTTEALNAFDQSLEKGREISASHAVTREVVGAQFDAEVTLQNTSDVAFALSNVEITVQTSDPQNPTRLASVATLLPSSALAGNAAIFTIGPNDSRGPVLFSNREIFPNLVEDLMRAPRTYVFTVANYDLATEDGRNFAFGLQTVRDRTAELAIDFGDGELRSRRVITAGVLNRPREQGGTIIGGFEGFSGTGTPRGIPLDFALQDILHMRKSHPPVIVAGPNMVGIPQQQATTSPFRRPVGRSMPP